MLVGATSGAAFCIVVRNFYRAVELGQGWKGYLITHEVYFAVLDGALMAICVLIFNVFFPARFVDGHDAPSYDGRGMARRTEKTPSTESA